ncbi:BESS domain-containing protein [Aphis craccivora]|uniref:BESS domain-containing protein n=1 Tax=Aphis craccivora TaxID=307492 RepID=A0A6G0WHV5_APHCR|nr:BESS domain-containing protein [Aphis craccivora]
MPYNDISSSISYQRPLSHMSQFNISSHQYTSQNSPTNKSSSTITSPPIFINQKIKGDVGDVL